MVLNATYGTKYTYRDIAGYVIQAGLQSNRGLGTRFNVYLILQSNTQSGLPELPIRDGKLNANDPWQEELRLATPDGFRVQYIFPKIQLRSYEGIYTDVNQYHLLGFSYPEGLTRFTGSWDLPEITLSNESDTNFRLNSSQSKGTISVNATGARSAQLLGFQAIHLTEGNVGFQMISERHRDGGWLQAILDQNKERCSEGQPVDLEFMLNGNVYDCSPRPGAHNLTGGMIYEERYGVALDYRIEDARSIVNRAGANAVTLPPPNLVDSSGITWRRMIDDWGVSTVEHTNLDFAVEVCTVISNSAEAREFDWRTDRQRNGN